MCTQRNRPSPASAVLEQIDAAIVELEQRALAAAPEVDAVRARETELSAATSGGSDGSAIDRNRESAVRDGLAQIRRAGRRNDADDP